MAPDWTFKRFGRRLTLKGALQNPAVNKDEHHKLVIFDPVDGSQAIPKFGDGLNMPQGVQRYPPGMELCRGPAPLSLCSWIWSVSVAEPRHWPYARRLFSRSPDLSRIGWPTMEKAVLTCFSALRVS